MHDDTPVVQRLLTLGQEATTESLSIILWCRRWQTKTKGFSPYVCLGRLAYHSHEPGSYPLTFVWKLLDHKAIQNHSDEEVRRRFQQCISQALVI
jgi:hypothetical protein